MSNKLIEAAAEFLSRDTSTKQTRSVLEVKENPEITKAVKKETEDTKSSSDSE